MTEPIHDPSCLSLQSGTDQRGFDYDAGNLPCTCAVLCDHCSEPAEFCCTETTCGRDHCLTHWANCKACQDDYDEFEDIA